MQLFKNESLRDTGPIGHELTFGNPLFGQRYARHPGQPRAFALSSAGLHGDDIDESAFARSIHAPESEAPEIEAEPPLVYPPLHLMRL
ncbi:hypothetical protein HIV01_014135 [Lysobacter arenosi]|jgi:hypothetical protein|uniref:Uncharacterized protein n=1 Tax=Lysobacter arenosi TaxID=2795387 RepID=A0ABX7R878_9GAMM|nr:hypothetical protein [Lysobacter arenosi]QSX74317.1 hypothetical protein HIV01_014135 [Lysobacter arenosi]